MRYLFKDEMASNGKKLQRPVEAVALLGLFFLSLPSAASTGPSWVEQPSWASDDNSPSSSSRRSSSASNLSTLKRDDLRSFNATPFAPGTNNLSLDVGQVFLMGDLGHYSDAIGGQIHYTYGVSDLFGFDSSLGYSSHSDGHFSMFSFLPGVRANLSWYDRVIPYVVFGMGFYKPTYTDTSGASLSPLLFGIHMGPGVDLAMTRQIFFGASLTFHDMFGNSQQTPNGQSQSVGGTFTSFLIRAGYTF